MRALASILRLDPRLFLHDTPNLTAFQLLLSASTGGLSLPDTVTLAPISFVSSIIDSHPALTSDPLLLTALSDPTQWFSSPLPTLTSFYSAFAAIIALPTLATPPTYDTDLHDSVHSLLFDPSTNLPSIANIHLLHNRHTQAVFATAKFRHSIALRLRSPLSHPHAVARVRACGLRGAASLLLCNSIPDGALLQDVEFQFFVCHRLGIPPPSVSPLACLRCTAKCRTITAAKPLTPDHALHPSHRHCYHQLTCGSSPLRHRRHDSLARCVADHLSAEAGLDATITAHLHSSLTTRTKVDLVLSSAASESPVAVDFTVSCPLLPSYIAHAFRDANAIIAARASEKTAKHAPGSAARNRLFLAWVITTFGAIGPAPVWYYVDTIYSSSSALYRLSRSTHHTVSRRKAAFLACFQAILTRSCFLMLTRHTTPSTTPVPRPPSSSAAPPAAAPPTDDADDPPSSSESEPDDTAPPPDFHLAPLDPTASSVYDQVATSMFG